MADVDSLQFESLTAAVEAIEIENMKGIEHYRASEDPQESDVAEWDLFTDSRDVSGLTSRNAPSTEQKGAKAELKSAKMAYYKKYFDITGDNLNNIRQPGTTQKDQMGQKYLARELNRLAKREQMMREKLLWQAFSGTITETLDDGVALAVSMGISGTHTPDVSATNDWDTVTVDPAKNIIPWKALIEEDSGRSGSIAWVNDTVMTMLFKNTKVREAIGEATVKEVFGQTGKVLRYCGLEWRQWDGKHSGGKFIPDDYVVITPDPGDWLAYKIGSVAVLNEGQDDIVRVPSPGSYSETIKNPVGVRVHVISCFLPVLQVPDSIIYAKVS